MGKNKPSTRAGQYKKASRERANRKRRKELSRSAKFIGVAGLGGGLLFFVVWVFVSGTASLWRDQVANAFYHKTAEAGFALTDVYLSGHDKLSKQAILHHSRLRYGEPILSLSLKELQQNLESLPQIRNADIRRQLPGALYIHITERYPVALWQEGEKLHLIDEDGVLMGDGDAVKHNHLPLLVGHKAPEHLHELFALLDTAPHLKEVFDSAVFVGGRRWNLWLTNGIEVKLPEDHAIDALAQLEKLQTQQPLQGADISSVDLRVPERMFLRPKVKLIQQASQQL